MQKKSKIIIISIVSAILLIVGVFTAIALTGAGNNTEKVTTEKLSLGQKFLLDLEYDKAVAEFQAVIDIEPKNVDAYIGLADAYIGLGDKEKAIETLEKGFMETGDETIRAKLDEIKEVEETTTAPETTTVATGWTERGEWGLGYTIREYDANGKWIKTIYYSNGETDSIIENLGDGREKHIQYYNGKPDPRGYDIIEHTDNGYIEYQYNRYCNYDSDEPILVYGYEYEYIGSESRLLRKINYSTNKNYNFGKVEDYELFVYDGNSLSPYEQYGYSCDYDYDTGELKGEFYYYYCKNELYPSGYLKQQKIYDYDYDGNLVLVSTLNYEDGEYHLAGDIIFEYEERNGRHGYVKPKSAKPYMYK